MLLQAVINIFATLISPTLVGWIFVRYLYKNDNSINEKLAKISYSFLAGYGVINLIFTGLIISGRAFSRDLVYVICLLALGNAIFASKGKLKSVAEDTIKLLKLIWEKKLITLAILIPIFIMLFNIFAPVKDWDTLALYDFRGRIFAEELRIEDLQEEIGNDYYYRYYFGYPYLTSISHAWSYSLKASSAMLIYSGYYASIILLIINEVLKKDLLLKDKFKLTHFIPILIALNPVILSHSTIAYTNLPYTAYLVASIILAINSIKHDYVSNIWLSLLMLVSSTLSRFTEPFYLSVIALAVIINLRKKRIYIGIIYAALLYLIRKIWMQYVVFGDELAIKALPEVTKNFNLPFFLEVQQFLLRNYLKTLTLPLTIYLVILANAIIRKVNIRFMWIVFWGVNLAILTLGGYFFALRLDIWRGIGPSAERMAIAFIPVIYFHSILLLKGIDESRN